MGIFDSVIATERGDNRKGVVKLAAIRKLLGDKEFDYVGDSMADLPVFRAARRAYLVCPGRSLSEAVRTGCRVAAVFDARGTGAR